MLINHTILAMCLILLFNYRNGNSQDYKSLFNEICDTIDNNFYDSNFKGLNWDSIKLSCVDNIQSIKNEVQFQCLLNTMLSKLNTSHCFYYIKSDQAYYHLLDLCMYDKGLREKINEYYSDTIITYTDIGILTKNNNGNTFINAIIDSTPAHKSGLLVGDRIVSVDGKPFEPIASFKGKEDKTVVVVIQRTKETKSTLSFKIEPKLFNPRQLFYDGIKNSIKIITKDTSAIAYIHLWSFTSHEYLNLLKETLKSSKFNHAEALILDLRDGWGGNGLEYLEIFRMNEKENGNSSQLNRNNILWSKPVVLLVNSGTRSGKEMFTYYFKKKNYGKIVGSTTAGAVRGGMLYFFNNGNLLMLAADPYFVDGTDLDGIGVQPDIVVNQNIEYVQGIDRQLETAIRIATSEIKR